MNPLGLVPTLLLSDNKVLSESLWVNEYLNEVASEYNPENPKVLPTDPYERWQVRRWISYFDEEILGTFYKL
jgi:glutathione S-transferase